MERQLSSADRRVTPEAANRLGEIILAKLRSEDHATPGYARRFISNVVVTHDTITISGPTKPLSLAIPRGGDHRGGPRHRRGDRGFLTLDAR